MSIAKQYTDDEVYALEDLAELDNMNPFGKYRPGQKEAIIEIIRNVVAGKRVIQLDGGVGSGKSLVLTIAARYLVSHLGWSKAIYTTPQVKLVDQLRDDKMLNIPTLTGKDNYPCPTFEGQTAADCPFSKKQQAKVCANVICQYRIAKEKFMEAEVGAATLPKIMSDKSIPFPELLIVDESSGLERDLIRMSEIILPDRIRDETLLSDLVDWYSDLKDQIDSLAAELNEIAEDIAMDVVRGRRNTKRLADAQDVSRRKQYTERKATKVLHLIGIVKSGQKYVINDERKFKTLDGRRQFAGMADRCQCLILSSGTPCPQLLAAEYVTVTMPNPIPASNRPVFFQPLGKMSSSVRSETVKKMVPRIAELHKKAGGNTLLHCYTYKNAMETGQALKRLGCKVLIMEQDDAAEKARVLKEWMASEKTILASVGCEEGVDCKGPKFNLNIIMMVPFAFRGEPWVLMREAEDEKLPNDQRHGVITSVVFVEQATGRTTRGPGPEEKSATWIFDSNFMWFYKQNRNVFNKSFIESLTRVGY